MIDKRIEEEAARILAEIGACLSQSEELAREKLVQALQAAEQRGWHTRAAQKQSSG